LEIENFDILKKYNYLMRNSTHSLWLVEIHMGPTKFIWDPHDLVGLMWILTNQRECVEKCVLEGVLLAFLLLNLSCLKSVSGAFVNKTLKNIVLSHVTLELVNVRYYVTQAQFLSRVEWVAFSKILYDQLQFFPLCSKSLPKQLSTTSTQILPK